MNETWREKAQILNGLVLKILALIFMTLDHVGLFLLTYLGSANMVGIIFRTLGRLAFPLFAFMLAEGIRKSHHKEKYLLRLALMWALITIAQVVLYYGFGFTAVQTSSNAFADLLVGGLFLYCLNCLQGKKKIFALIPLLIVLGSYAFQVCYINIPAMSSAPYFLFPGYSIFGFLMIVGFYYAKNIVDKISAKYLEGSGQSLESFQETRSYQGLLNMLCACVIFLVTIICWGISYIPSIQFDVVVMHASQNGQVAESWCLLAILPLLLYNGKRGPDSKPFRIFTYAYYPMHIAIIFAIFYIIFEL